MKASQTIVDLRSHLFDVIEQLKDPDAKKRMDIDVANSICLAAKRLIETASVEIQFRHVMGHRAAASTFMKLPAPKRP